MQLEPRIEVALFVGDGGFVEGLNFVEKERGQVADVAGGAVGGAGGSAVFEAGGPVRRVVARPGGIDEFEGRTGARRCDGPGGEFVVDDLIDEPASDVDEGDSLAFVGEPAGELGGDVVSGRGAEFRSQVFNRFAIPCRDSVSPCYATSYHNARTLRRRLPRDSTHGIAMDSPERSGRCKPARNDRTLPKVPACGPDAAGASA